MKVGYIDYVNCYPFYHTIFEDHECSGNEIVPAQPAVLNNLMRNGNLDLSPISSAAYSDMTDSLYLLPDFCLSSEGYVRSVVLLSHIPIEELSGKTVGLTRASETSRVLLKILLQKYYNIDCRYENADAEDNLEDFDAMLIIGNEALKVLQSPVEYIYDIGDLWLRKTSFPVVFAVFGLQKQYFENNRSEVFDLIECFENSLNYFNLNKKKVIFSAEKRYPEVDFDIGEYYTLLKYNFTDSLKSALIFYYEKAAELSLLKPVKNLNFISGKDHE